MPFFLFASSVLCLLLAFSMVPRLKAPGALPFFASLVGIFFYGFGYAMELVTPPGGANGLWNHVQYLGVATIPAFWLWISLEVPRPDRISNPAVLLGLLLIPTVTLVLNLTNQAHHLYYASLTFVSAAGMTRAVIVPGPWYLVHTVFTLGAYASGIVLYLVTWRRRGGGNRSPYLGITLATVPTVAVFVGYHFGALGGGFDIIPLGLSVTAFLFFWLLWPLRLFDLQPVTREAVFRLVPDPVVVLDPRGLLVDWNPAAVALFPGLRRSRLGQAMAPLLADRSDWVQAFTPAAESARDVLPLGEAGVSWWSMVRSPVFDRRGRLAACVFLLHEQTELVERAEVYHQLALTDELTGCLNRRAFFERSRALMAARSTRKEPVSVIAVDLDRFKDLNDTWGHAAGDAALKHAAGLWEGVLRAGDILGRLGGEEFAVFLPGTGPETALAVAGRLCDRMRDRPLDWEGKTLAVTGSFGVVGLVDASSSTLEVLLRNADAALYEAKDGGRNRVVLGRTEPG